MRASHTEHSPKTIDVNCKGVVNGIGAVLSSMLERKTGHIVNISSDAGRKVCIKWPGGLHSQSPGSTGVPRTQRVLRFEILH